MFLYALLVGLWVYVPSLGAETKRQANQKLYQEIIDLQKEGKNTESILPLETYLERNPSELYLRLVYAKALLYRTDLQLPDANDDAFERAKKRRIIRENYTKSARVFQENVLHFQRVRPRDPTLGKWFYLWGFAEWFSGNKLRAIGVFQRAVKVDYTLSESYYNIASIYESLGQEKDSKIYFQRYIKHEEGLVDED